MNTIKEQIKSFEYPVISEKRAKDVIDYLTPLNFEERCNWLTFYMMKRVNEEFYKTNKPFLQKLYNTFLDEKVYILDNFKYYFDKHYYS